MNQDQFFARYGVSTWLYLRHRLPDALEKIADAGFRIIELWANEVHLDPRLKPDIPGTRAIMAALGMRAHSLHAPFYGELRIGDPDPAYRARWRAAMEPTLCYAAELGARGVVFHVSTISGENDERSCAEGAKVVVAFVEEELRPLARQAGVHLLLENMVDHGWPRFGCSMAELTSAFPGDDYRFCLDIGHTTVNKLDQKAEISQAGKRLMSIHGSNNDGQHDLHQAPTDGVIDWPGFMSALDTAAYDHPIILEVKGGDDPDAVLARLREFWRYLPD
ncbi:MAG: sugar phosphate isomerase/epimerase [Bacteroidetes bacterium]|nr:sugar phosphate isomerase/epimerase [Bacteroidota bacterium]MCL5027049.1 sugar phosphate isomerase/epimerase [Chloroflexota bacterium]